MWHFQRIDPLQLILSQKYIVFVGAGGKTSLSEYMGERLINAGKTVAITTTTKIYAREPYCVTTDTDYPAKLTMPLIRVGKTIEDGKLTAVETNDILRLGALYDAVLIEADGAKGKPLKFPAPYEPVIPSVADKIFVVCGIDALYKQVHDVVFRWELLRDEVGIGGNTVITPDIFMRFFSGSILFKGVDLQKCCVVLNKYDSLTQKRYGSYIASWLCSNVEGLEVIISSVNLRTFYKISTE